MKKIWVPVVALTLAGAAIRMLPAQETAVRWQRMGGNLIPGAPYSADAAMELTRILGDGNRIFTTTPEKIYRDGRGRERWEQINQMGTQISISDPVLNTGFRLDGKTGAAKQDRLREVGWTPLTSPQTLEFMGLPPQTPVVERLDPRAIEGVAAIGTRFTVTIPAGHLGNERAIPIVSEVWYSPELQIDLSTSYSDARTGVQVERLYNIKREEPDAGLFQVISGRGRIQ